MRNTVSGTWRLSSCALDAKAIYYLKLFLFHKKYTITQKQEYELKLICYFIIKYYAETWFSATNAITAPMNDIYFF